MKIIPDPNSDHSSNHNRNHNQIGLKRQFQQPAFSNKGKYVAFAEMHVKEAGNGEIEINVLPSHETLFRRTNINVTFST